MASPSPAAETRRPLVRMAWVVAYVAWLCLIWGHSLMRGSASQAESDASVLALLPLFQALGVSGSLAMTRIVRKGAHMAEYAVLCAIGRGATHAWCPDGKQALMAQALAWVAVPCVDETIQLFVPGRSGELTDVLIDMLGGLVGIALSRMLSRAVLGRREE